MKKFATNLVEETERNICSHIKEMFYKLKEFKPITTIDSNECIIELPAKYITDSIKKIVIENDSTLYFVKNNSNVIDLDETNLYNLKHISDNLDCLYDDIVYSADKFVL